MLKKLPPINAFPEEILTEEFKDICKDYNNSLKKVARINNTSRIIISDTIFDLIFSHYLDKKLNFIISNSISH